MANFTRVRSTGMWTVSVLTPEEMEKFDANLAKAPNFVDGGTYAPTTAITIGGQGFYLTGPFETEGTFATYGDTFIGSDSTDALVVSAESTFNAPVTANALTTVTGVLTATDDVNLGTDSGDAINIAGILNAGAANFGGYTAINAAFYVQDSITTDGYLVVATDATVNGLSTFNDNVTIAAGASLTISSGTATFGGGMTIAAAATLANGGQILDRTLWVADSSQTVHCDRYERVVVTSLSETRVITLHDAAAVENSRVLVVNRGGGGFAVTVTDNIPALSFSLGTGYAAVFTWHSGSWVREYSFAVT